MKTLNSPFTRKLLLTALLAAFSAQALATTYVYRKYIPGLKESLSSLEARTVPFIDHILPAGGDTAGGNTMAIYATPDGLNPLYGHGFAPGTTVSVDGVLASSALQGVVSPGMGASLNVLMPFHAVGTAQVVVTDPSGATVSAPYAYTHDVTVSAVSPSATLTAGTSLTIYGTGFVSGSSVTIDGVPAQLTAAYSTQLVATAPSHAAGAASLTVTNPDTSSFTFTGLSYGVPATDTFSATSFAAGTVVLGQSATLPAATISNTGDFTLNYAALSGLPSGWTQTGTCNSAGGSVAGKSSCTLVFTFAPTSTTQGGGSVVFTPTNTGLTATTLSLTGTAVAPPTYATLTSSGMSGGLTLSNGNLTVTDVAASGFSYVHTTQSKSSGKWYWEETSTSWNSGVTTGSNYTTVSGTCMYALDLDNNALYSSCTGSWPSTQNPTSGSARTGAYTAFTLPTGPMLETYGAGNGAVTVNFGATPFKCTPPAGYHAGWYQ